MSGRRRQKDDVFWSSLTIEHVEVIQSLLAGDGDQDEGAEKGQTDLQMWRHDDDVTRNHYGHCSYKGD